MASPEGLRELGFRSVITSLRGGRRSNHRLTGARETHPWSGGGVAVVVVLKPAGPRMPASVQSCSVHSVQSPGGLGYRQPQRHTNFREVWGLELINNIIKYLKLKRSYTNKFKISTGILILLNRKPTQCSS